MVYTCLIRGLRRKKDQVPRPFPRGFLVSSSLNVTNQKRIKGKRTRDRGLFRRDYHRRLPTVSLPFQ